MAETTRPGSAGPGAFFIDLVFYLSLMFLIREIYFPSMDFLVNGLFWSFTTLIFATWRMRARGVSWADLGLCMPKSLKTTAIATGAIIGMAIGFIIISQMLLEQFPLGLAADQSEQNAAQKFGDLKGNWLSLLAILPLVWLQSLLEEALDRGFLLTWIERMFSSTLVATVLAVVLQAMIFGFRHTQDLSERSITVGLIGLAMGIGYVVFGRNLWPLIIAHIALNTVSMVGRVL